LAFFFVIIVAATFLLKALFNFGTNYMPSIYEPKDLDREKILKKQGNGGNQGQPPQP
jgi:hypothetical protein